MFHHFVKNKKSNTLAEMLWYDEIRLHELASLKTDVLLTALDRFWLIGVIGCCCLLDEVFSALFFWPNVDKLVVEDDDDVEDEEEDAEDCCCWFILFCLLDEAVDVVSMVDLLLALLTVIVDVWVKLDVAGIMWPIVTADVVEAIMFCCKGTFNMDWYVNCCWLLFEL